MSIIQNDRIGLIVKRSSAVHIIGCYGAFGWTAEDGCEGGDSGRVQLSFTRPHNIERKDELQLLQVRLEKSINETGKFSVRKMRRTLVFALSSLVFALACIACSVCFFMLFNGMPTVITGAVLCAEAILSVAFAIPFSLSLYKRDKLRYGRLLEREFESIERICMAAIALRTADER